MTMVLLPTWCSTAHFLPSSANFGVLAATGLATCLAATVGPEESPEATRPLLSALFLLFMSSVTFLSPLVIASPLLSSWNTADMPSPAGLGLFRPRDPGGGGGGGGGGPGASDPGGGGGGGGGGGLAPAGAEDEPPFPPGFQEATSPPRGFHAGPVV